MDERMYADHAPTCTIASETAGKTRWARRSPNPPPPRADVMPVAGNDGSPQSRKLKDKTTTRKIASQIHGIAHSAMPAKVAAPSNPDRGFAAATTPIGSATTKARSSEADVRRSVFAR